MDARHVDDEPLVHIDDAVEDLITTARVELAEGSPQGDTRRVVPRLCGGALLQLQVGRHRAEIDGQPVCTTQGVRAP